MEHKSVNALRLAAPQLCHGVDRTNTAYGTSVKVAYKLRAISRSGGAFEMIAAAPLSDPRKVK